MPFGHYNAYPSTYLMCGECGWGAGPNAPPGGTCPMCGGGTIVSYERTTLLADQNDSARYAVMAEANQDHYFDFRLVGPTVEIDAAECEGGPHPAGVAAAEAINQGPFEVPEAHGHQPVDVFRISAPQSLDYDALLDVFKQRFDWYPPAPEA